MSVVSVKVYSYVLSLNEIGRTDSNLSELENLWENKKARIIMLQ